MRLSLVSALLFLNTLCSWGNVVYYVSTSKGNSNNSGLTEDSPLKNIRDIKEKNGVTIKLKRGDVFFENIVGYKNSIVESYGEGELPVLCGFKILKNPRAWEKDTKNNCWVLDMENQDIFTGYSGKGLDNDVGCIYLDKEDIILGNLKKSISELKQNGDFYTSSKSSAKDTKAEDFRYLYLKYDRHPSELGNLCFSLRKTGVSTMTNCTIRDIAVVGFGGHGMCVLDKCTVDNCKIDIIGGSIQIGIVPWVRFGNGIEFYINENPIGNTIVKNCTISRTFDCATTIQGTGEKMGDAKNIRFTNNYIINCRQAFEHFLQSGKGKSYYINCSFDHNVCVWSGDNKFNCPEIRDAAILSYELQDKNCVISDNIFYGSNYYFGNMSPNGMKDNKVYVYEDSYIHHTHFKSDSLPILYARNAQTYSDRTKDNSRITIIERGSRKDKKLSKKITNQVDWNKIDLHLERIL